MKASGLPWEETVPRETLARLEALVSELKRWNKRINLISRATEETVWKRHVHDSVQLWAFAPDAARRWTDLGSGAGFPGLVIAAVAADARPDMTVALIESDQRKCAFLASAARAMAVSVDIVNARIESADAVPSDVVSARALAPLTKLLDYAQRFCHQGTVCLFPKGREADSELTEARADWHIDLHRHRSATDPLGTIFEITGFERQA